MCFTYLFLQLFICQLVAKCLPPRYLLATARSIIGQRRKGKMPQSNPSSRILIADDHPLTREGLALAARAASQGVSVDTAGSIKEALFMVSERSTYRLILLDLVLPDAHGFSGLMQLQHVAKATPIAMISAKEDAPLVEAARALGAAGFLYKTRPLDVLVGEIREILAGNCVFAHEPSSGSAAALSKRIASLSSAQLKVLVALADGRLNKQIAGDLALSEATVKSHLSAIFRKLGVVNRAQALLAVQPLLGGQVAGGVAT